MKKIPLLKIITTVLFLFFLQACYVGVAPDYDSPRGGGVYEPPPIGFEAPSHVIVMPDTDDVYVVPHIGIDLFF